MSTVKTVKVKIEIDVDELRHPTTPRESKIPPGCYLVAPFPLEDGATWGDLRRLVDLGQHYDDDAPIKLDWTEHYATNGQITTPSGVIVEGA